MPGRSTELEAFALVLEPAFAAGDGLARPVAHMLIAARESVEDGALAHVRVAGQRDAMHARHRALSLDGLRHERA